MHDEINFYSSSLRDWGYLPGLENYNNAIFGAGRKALVLPWAGTFSPPFLRLGTTCQR